MKLLYLAHDRDRAEAAAAALRSVAHDVAMAWAERADAASDWVAANRDLAARGAVVWGVSPQGAASKVAFRDKFQLAFPLLIDADHAVAEAYGSWVEKQQYGRTYMGVARRTFLVAPDGAIARTWEKVKPEGHAVEVLAALDAAAAQA